MSKRIMVMNDTKEILELFHAILTEEGYEVFLGAFGANDLTEIQRIKPDFVILDYAVHKEELGWQLLQKMKMTTDTANIPVLICSTDMKLAEERQAYLISKGIDVLPKPFDIDELVAAVKRGLELPKKIGSD
jgi:DNA-binding response OmpR family regulator